MFYRALRTDRRSLTDPPLDRAIQAASGKHPVHRCLQQIEFHKVRNVTHITRRAWDHWAVVWASLRLDKRPRRVVHGRTSTHGGCSNDCQNRRHDHSSPPPRCPPLPNPAVPFPSAVLLFPSHPAHALRSHMAPALSGPPRSGRASPETAVPPVHGWGATAAPRRGADAPAARPLRPPAAGAACVDPASPLTPRRRHRSRSPRRPRKRRASEGGESSRLIWGMSGT